MATSIASRVASGALTSKQAASAAALKSKIAASKTPTVAKPTAPSTPNVKTVSQSSVRPAGTKFDPMQDLQRSQKAAEAANLPSGGFVLPSAAPTVVPKVNVDKTVPAVDLGNAPAPVTVDQPATINPDATVGATTDFLAQQKAAADAAAKLAPNQYAAENTALYDRVKALYQQQTGKAVDLAKAQEKAGVSGIEKQIQEQNLLITNLANQYNRNIASLPGQGRGITTGIISAQTDRERRLAAADISAQTSLLQAYQGNLELAKQSAQNAVDLKYGPIESEINSKLKLLELNYPNFTAAEKKQADIVSSYLQSQKDQTAQQKEKELAISNVLAEAAKNGATTDVINKIKSSASLNDAIVNAGSFIAPIEEDKLLSPSEAKTLGVPYGTTQKEAASYNIKPSSTTKSTSAGTVYKGSGSIPTSDGNTVKVSSLSKSVYENPALLDNLTLTEKGKILKELSTSGADMSRFTVNKINAGQRDQIAQYDDLVRQGKEAENILTTSKLDTGPIASRYQAAKSLVGAADPSFNQYRSVVDNMSSALLKLRSGAAVTPQEFERIKGFIPSINDDEKTAKQKIGTFYSELDTARANYIKRSTQSSQQILDSSIKNDQTNLRTKYSY